MKTTALFFALLLAASIFSQAQIFNAITPPTGLLAQSQEENKPNVSGRVHKSILASGGISVVMENFDFDFNFYVLDFDVSIVTTGGFTASESWRQGRAKKPAKNFAAFNAEQQRLINRCKRGQRVTIENIKVRGDDGSIRYLNDVIVKIL